MFKTSFVDRKLQILYHFSTYQYSFSWLSVYTPSITYNLSRINPIKHFVIMYSVYVLLCINLIVTISDQHIIYLYLTLNYYYFVHIVHICEIFIKFLSTFVTENYHNFCSAWFCSFSHMTRGFVLYSVIYSSYVVYKSFFTTQWNVSQKVFELKVYNILLINNNTS